MNASHKGLTSGRLLLLFTCILIFSLGRAGAEARIDYCWNVCDGLVPCETDCIDVWEDETTCGEQGVETCAYYSCGDGFCFTSAGENEDTCPEDCDPGIDEPYCGDNRCDPGEGPRSCPSDCGPGITCGDGICDWGENPNNCPADCYYTDWCNSQQDCDNQHGSGSNFICRGKRCVYSPILTFCTVLSADISCAGNSTCVQLTPDDYTGVCIPRF